MKCVLVVAASVLGAVLTGGCGASTIEGSAVIAESPSASAVAFDPCMRVTDALVTSLGLMPKSKTPYTAKGATVESGCSWKDADTMTRLRLDIGVNNTPFNKYLSDLGYANAPRQSIGGRRAANFQSARQIGTCSLAIDLGSAVAIVATSSSSQTSAPNPDSCPDAERIAAAISPVLP